MKKKLFFCILITAIIKLLPYTENQLLPDGSMDVSFYQFNDTEAEWVGDESMLGSFTQYFEKTVMTSFEDDYCRALQKTYQDYQLSEIQSLFGSLFASFLNHRCTAESCVLSQYWNETNQNLMPLETYYSYTSEAIYLMFPLFLTMLMAGFAFGFINCLYFNYCYCCCYALDPNKKTEEYFKKMFIFLAISFLINLCGGVFLMAQFMQKNTFEGYIVCQAVSTNIYQVVTGINLTDAENNATQQNDINWQGLNYLNSTFQNYFADFELVRSNLVAGNNSYLVGPTDPVDKSYNALQIGIDAFKNYISRTSFDVVDSNGNTFTCAICKDSYTIDAAILEINQTLYSWQLEMRDYRDIIFTDLIDNNGWSNLVEKHEDTIFKIKENIYKSYKFYNIVMDNFDVYQTNFASVQGPGIGLFVVNSLVSVLGVIGYRWVKASIDEINENQEALNYKGAAERNTVKIRGRWTFHLVTHFNIITSTFIAAFSFMLILLAVFVFEGAFVMENYFFNEQRMGNFTFIPHGELIDICADPAVGNVDDYFNFREFDDYYQYMINYTESITNFAIASEGGFPKYIDLVSFVSSMDLSNFHSVTDGNLKWDASANTQMYETISNYKQNHKTMIEDNYASYKTALKDAYNFYDTLTDNFDQMRKWFIRDIQEDGTSLDRSGLMSNTDCSFLRDNYKVFYFARTLMGETYFGLSIIIAALSFFLFTTATLILIVFLRLRTDNELSDLRNHLATIKTIEDKEKRFFFADNNFIETDDAKMMGLNEEEEENNIMKNVIKNFLGGKSRSNKNGNNENNDRNSIAPNFRPSSVRTSAIMALNKKLSNDEGKKTEIVKKFLLRQEKEYDERRKKEQAEINKLDKE